MTNDQEILDYIKTQQEVAIPELQKKFSADYLGIVKLIRKLVADGVLRLDSGVQYSVIKKSGGDGAADNDKGDDDESDDDEDDIMAQRRAYLEARRRELIRRMQSDMDDDDDDDNDDDDDDDDSEDEEGDSNDETPPVVYAISQALGDGVSVVESEGEHYLIPEGLEIGETAIRFKILVRDDGVYLSDDELALLSLDKRVSFDDEGIDEQIGFIVDRYGIGVVGDELRIKVESPENTVTCMMQLFAAMERIVTIDEDDIAACIEYEKEDRRIWDATKEFLTADPDMDRGELILRMRERYQSVKDGENIDDIIIYARAVKEFARMSDEDYEESRDFLLDMGKKQDDGETDSAEEKEDVSAIVNEDKKPISKEILAQEVEGNADIITETLAGFHINAEVAKVTTGATVMRFELVVPSNVPISAVAKRDAELAMRLGQRDGVRVYADTSSGRICVEVPRIVSDREKVQAVEFIRSENERWDKSGALFFGIGKNVDGEFVYGDIARLKHILIGGSCCSGKTTLLHTMIYSFITRYSPDEVRLILCDAKKTEFAHYRGMPHLLTGQIVTEAEQMVRTLRWANKEMERRYQLFERKTAEGDTVRNLDEYNAVREGDETKLPHIVIIIDDYADFISVSKRDIEETVQRLAQKARAAGIHLVLATQRPTADVVTGVLRANLPTRIAFRVIQEIDSRAILDESGAEKLLGLGDLLMRSESDFRCERIQGAYIPHETLIAAVAATKKMYEAKFDEEAKKYIKRTAKKTASNASNKDLEEYPVDPFYIKALAIVIQAGEASISLVQRKCCIGYNHAGKIIEWMESMGYVSPFDKSKGRQILITKKQFVKKYGPLD